MPKKELKLDSLTTKTDRDMIYSKFEREYYRKRVDAVEMITQCAFLLAVNKPRYANVKKELLTEENYKKAADILRGLADLLEIGVETCCLSHAGCLKKQTSRKFLKEAGDVNRIKNMIKERVNYMRP